MLLTAVQGGRGAGTAPRGVKAGSNTQPLRQFDFQRNYTNRFFHVLSNYVKANLIIQIIPLVSSYLFSLHPHFCSRSVTLH